MQSRVTPSIVTLASLPSAVTIAPFVDLFVDLTVPSPLSTSSAPSATSKPVSATVTVLSIFIVAFLPAGITIGAPSAMLNASLISIRTFSSSPANIFAMSSTDATSWYSVAPSKFQTTE